MSNFTRDDFKISFLRESYHVSHRNRTVSCTMRYRLNAPEGFYAGFFDGLFEVKVATATAYCAPEDVFDVATGKRIARTKVENKIYAKVGATVKKISEELSEMVMMAGCFTAKKDSVIRHNMDYLKRIDDSVKHRPVEDKDKNQLINTAVKNTEDVAPSNTNKPYTREYTRKTPFGDVHVKKTYTNNSDPDFQKKMDEFNSSLKSLEDEFNEFWKNFLR